MILRCAECVIFVLTLSYATLYCSAEKNFPVNRILHKILRAQRADREVNLKSSADDFLIPTTSTYTSKSSSVDSSMHEKTVSKDSVGSKSNDFLEELKEVVRHKTMQKHRKLRHSFDGAL